MSHLKAEIIYFNGTTDFEFEFNLNAISPMRLLTECPTDEKGLICALSLAVSRSRVTFITSNFDDSFVETIAHAVGFKTETIISEEYGITERFANKFISNGVPLVTADGKYGGIILESGPQSLILITNDKAVRKQLMNELVKGYILDVAATSDEQVNVQKTGAVKEYKTEIEQIDSFLESTETEAESNTINEEPIDADESVVNETAETIENKVTIPKADDALFDFPEQPKAAKQKNIFATILAIILFLLIAFIVYSLVIEPILNGVSILDNLKQIFGFVFE